MLTKKLLSMLLISMTLIAPPIYADGGKGGDGGNSIFGNGGKGGDGGSSVISNGGKGGDGGSSIFRKSGQGGKDGQCTLSIFKKCIKGKDAKNVKNNRKNLIND